jgi:hypothetical protein
MIKFNLLFAPKYLVSNRYPTLPRFGTDFVPLNPSFYTVSAVGGISTVLHSPENEIVKG